jgi:hypothetical protein
MTITLSECQRERGNCRLLCAMTEERRDGLQKECPGANTERSVIDAERIREWKIVHEVKT